MSQRLKCADLGKTGGHGKVSGSHGSTVCVLAPAPFRTGGIERLTWDVRAALAAAVGDRNVFLGLLVGPENPEELRGRPEVTYAAGYPLSPAKKLRFGGWTLSFAGRHRDAALLCMHPNQAQLAWAARRLFGTRYAVWAHGGEVWSKMQSLPLKALRGADLVLCSSNFTRDYLVEHQAIAPGRAVTVYPPVTEELLRRASSATRTAAQTEPVILSVGRVERGYEYKGFDTVIRALPRIVEWVPGARYVIVGGGDGLPALRALARDVGVESRVTFAGRLSEGELAAAYEEARVFVMPSRLTLGRVANGEGFGIVYLEAAAFGRPVVAGNMGGASEAVVEGVTGHVVDPNDLAQLGEALASYLRDPTKAARAGEAGRARVRGGFTSARFGDNLAAALAGAGLLRLAGYGSRRV